MMIIVIIVIIFLLPLPPLQQRMKGQFGAFCHGFLLWAWMSLAGKAYGVSWRRESTMR